MTPKPQRVAAGLMCLAFLATGVAAAQTAVRIMPLGDSITQGDDASYRRPLWILLENAGLDVDFVGSMSAGYTGGAGAGDYDPDHEGHWGWRADQVLDRIDGWAAEAAPDMVLLHLGTNDVGGGQDIEETVAEVAEIITRLRAHNPRVHILLAAIIPVAYDGVTARIQRYNAALASMADSTDTPASRVILVDQFTGFDAHRDTYDGVHPNENGNQKMANRWSSGILALLEATGSE